MDTLERHYTNRSNWIRAAVLGANDGILSISALAVGVATATSNTTTLLIATLSGLAGGALSMAAGEYVSVSSQKDIEQADLDRERKELETMPEQEERELAKIYIARGLDKDLALEVARQMHEHDALEAHARDELGINDITAANPLQAAFASALSFVLGGAFPILVLLLAPHSWVVPLEYLTTLSILGILGAFSAHLGGSSMPKAVVRILLWGTITMGISAAVGSLLPTDLPL